MSYTPFKEVTVANPGSATRYGSDDLLDVMKIFNAKVVSNKRPEIINPWRWSSWMEVKQVTEASVTTPTEANVAHLFLSATDNKLKLKKTGGTITNLEDVGTGTWSPTSTETVSNKTVNIDTNTIKHSTTNATGDIMRYDAASGKYTRLAKGTALQVLQVNTAGTDLEYGTPASGGGGGGEANTASNVGSAGIGLFYQKLGIDLQFKSIFSPDASVLISDDTGNQKVDISLGAGVAKINTANTFGDFQNTFRSSRLAIANPANSAAYFFVASALTASRNITLPLLAANDIMATEAFAQTLTNKTMGTGTVANIDTITLKHSTTNLAGELLVNNGTKYDRLPKGAANTFLSVNASGTDLAWATPTAATFNLDSLTDVTITSPASGHSLLFNGSVWVNSVHNLDSATDVVIATPTNGQHLVYNGTNWVNTTPAGGTTREVLAAAVGGGHADSMGTSYTDMLAYQVDNTGSIIENNQNVVVDFDIDFTGFTQYKVVVTYTKDDTSSGDTHDIKVVDSSNSANFFEIFNVANGTTTKSLAALAAWMTGVKRLKLQHKANGSGNTPTMHNFSIYLK